MKIITAANASYLPGVIALYNSYLVNASKHEFICLVHTKEDLYTFTNAGIDARLVHWKIEALPITQEWPIAEKAMYSRLLIPQLYPDEICLWVDADAIIVNKLPELEMEHYPCASVITSTKTIGEQIGGKLHSAIARLPAVQTGVLGINCPVWNAQQTSMKCLDTMKKDFDFLFVVQSVLSLALLGNFQELPYKWNTFANRGRIPEDTLIAHFVGQSFLPWKNKNIPNIKLWEQYYNNGHIKK